MEEMITIVHHRQQLIPDVMFMSIDSIHVKIQENRMNKRVSCVSDVSAVKAAPPLFTSSVSYCKHSNTEFNE